MKFGAGGTQQAGSIKGAGKLMFQIRTILQKFGAGEGRWDGDRVQALYKAVSEPLLGLTDVEDATSGAADAIDHIDGCTGEPLSNMEGLFGALNG
eukprot:g38197.t1